MSEEKAMDEACKAGAHELQDMLDEANAKIVRLENALKPFSSFAKRNTEARYDGRGGQWQENCCRNERIVDWFGPSDFQEAKEVIMGMYDEVSLKCPTCGHLCYVQTKVAECQLRTYEQNDVPANIAEDINEQNVYCEECENISSVVADVFVRVKLQ